MKTFNKITENYTTPRGVIITIKSQIPEEEKEVNAKGIELQTIDLPSTKKEEIISIFKQIIKNPSEKFDHYENLHEFIDIMIDMKETFATLS